MRPIFGRSARHGGIALLPMPRRSSRLDLASALLSPGDMAHVEALDDDRTKQTATRRQPGTEGAAAILLVVVVALAALGEVVASRSLRTSPAAAVPSWEAALQAGDEARARGDVATARRAYMRALFRARGEQSRVGVLRAAEGFHHLGDREVVAQALRIAAALGADRDTDPEVFRRLQSLNDEVQAGDALPTEVQPLP
jgi:hypothetical protein